MWIHLLALGLIDGASGNNPAPVVNSSNSGGWFPNVRRKTRKEVYAERVRLGILPATVAKAAERVAEKVEVVPKRITPDLQKLMMAELKVTKWAPDYSRAIELALRLRQMEQDDEDVLLLM